MINDVNFSEEIEKIAEIFLPLAPKNFEEIYIYIMYFYIVQLLRILLFNIIFDIIIIG